MTTYSITLDDVDLALLPLRTHKYNDFLKKDHFHFQVMRTDINDEPEPPILYTCHICAIQVPAAFAREHAASIKHRANARIASVAAERTRALITALPPPTCAQPTARFCANCATVVGRNHDKTKEHRVAVMHDKLLWELMTAYVGYGDGDENYDSDYSEPEYITTDSGVKKETGDTQDCNDDENYGPEWSEPDYIPLDSGNKKETCSQDCNDFEPWDKVNGQEEKQNKALNTTEAKKEINKNEVNEENRRKDDREKENVDNKIKISDKPDNIKSSNNKIKLSEKIDNIESTHGETEIIPNGHDSPVRKTEPITKGEENPTSIKPKDTNFQVNKEPETTNVDAPSIKPKATENVKIEYIEFVTKDNKQVKVFSDHYHSFTRKVDTTNCIVCSITFKNEDELSHMFTLNHLNKMPSTLIDEHCVRQINDTYSHCILCNQMVKNSNVAKHCLTIGHGQREKQAVTDTNQATTSKIDKTVTRDVASANIFINAKAANTKEKPKTPEIAQNAPNEAKSSIDWPVIYPFEVTEQENTVRCLICDCKVPNNPDNRKGHLLGGNHAKNVKNKRKNLYPYENTALDGVARCVICDVKVTISPENLKEHLTGLSHAKNVIRKCQDAVRAMAKLLDEEGNKVCLAKMNKLMDGISLSGSPACKYAGPAQGCGGWGGRTRRRTSRGAKLAMSKKPKPKRPNTTSHHPI